MRHVPPGSRSRVSSPTRNETRAAQHHPELLVVVAVLGYDGRGLELDHGEADALAVHGARDGPVPDLEWRQGFELLEYTHARGG